MSEGIREYVYVYHVKEATGEIVKIEELDEKTGQRTEIPMTPETFVHEPYELEVETYGNDLYGLEAHG